jgi:hypothetical protein
MKKLILVIIALASSMVHAADLVTVLEADLPYLRTGRASADSRFHIDTDTKEGFVKVEVSELETIYTRPMGCGGYYGPRGPRGPRMPRGPRYCPPMPTTVQRTVFQTTVKIENMILVDKQVIYQGTEGEVVCGTMGTSRVMRVPTLYLSGNCELTSRVLHGGRYGSRVVVTLKTK